MNAEEYTNRGIEYQLLEQINNLKNKSNYISDIGINSVALSNDNVEIKDLEGSRNVG